jgi:D-3-phosphoglycerate dehydrogenase / 2-oxoglutarate reductase
MAPSKSTRPVILSLTNMHEAGMSLLREASDLRMASATDPETLRREVAGVDGLILRTGGIVDAALMDRGKDLKVVGRHGVGYDAIDVAAATERGIQVVYTPGANTQSVAEHVFAMMIGLSKHFTRMQAAVTAYDYHARTRWTGRDLYGRTLGIIGFGRIGRRVGAIARSAFDMSVLYNDIVAPPPEAEAKAGARRASFEEVLRASEYVTLHVPLDASTRHMIDRRALALMRPDAILINCARGPVVVEADVAEALAAGNLWGFGADVFEDEPFLPGHPLVGRDDVILTPHSAAQTVEGLTCMALGVAEEVLGVLRGDRPKNPVNDPAVVEASRRRLGLPPLYRS